MPDLQTIFSVFILGGLIFAATAILLVPDWRIALFALALQYVLITVLLTNFIQFPTAILRFASGILALAILFVTLRRVEGLQNSRDDDTRARLRRFPVFHVGFPFRVFALAFVLISITSLVLSTSFLGLPSYLLFSSLCLMMSGILVSVLSHNAPRLGMGILLFTGGFSILDMAIEGSLFLYGLINISDLLLALLISHLAALPVQPEQDSRRRGELP